jgi:1-acyl-sn-glycerol-3-phosphate acyltransferase
VPPWVLISLGLAGAAFLVIGLLWTVRRTPARTPHDMILHVFGRVYARLFHKLTIDGRGYIPKDRSPGPLIVLANHTAGVDPILIAAACPFHIRWVMAQDMRARRLEWFWRWHNVIFVSRSGRDRSAVREALRHLEQGGVIGIFPEGSLERPPRQIRPFRRGVGLMIHRSKAPVLPIVIDGTPQVDPAWASLWHRSSSSVTAHEIIDYSRTDLTGAEIAEHLRQRFMDWTGWPANDQPRERTGVDEGERAKGRTESASGETGTNAA